MQDKIKWMKDARKYADILWCYEELIDDHIDLFEELCAEGQSPLDAVKQVGEEYHLTPTTKWFA